MALKSVKKPQAQKPAVQELPTAQPMPEETRLKIAEVAYYRAQERGFSPGYELEDWLAAEAEVKKNGLGRIA
jgi:hypothetical protein